MIGCMSETRDKFVNIILQISLQQPWINNRLTADEDMPSIQGIKYAMIMQRRAPPVEI